SAMTKETGTRLNHTYLSTPKQRSATVCVRIVESNITASCGPRRLRALANCPRQMLPPLEGIGLWTAQSLPHCPIAYDASKRSHSSSQSSAQASRGQPVPRYLSSDNDPLFRLHQWQANLRILETQEIKTLPYVPLSHPFVERLIGTIRRECLDLPLFWTRQDLECELRNHHRAHASRAGYAAGNIRPKGPGESPRQAMASTCWRCLSNAHCRLRVDR